MFFFFQNAAANLRCCWTASTKTRVKSIARQFGHGKVQESGTLEMALEM